MGDRLHGQRALAQGADHLFAACLDTLGDGDLAFARQQLDTAHLAQIHAHRVVGAADILIGQVAGCRRCLFGRRRCFLVLFAVDDIDAHLRKHGHRIFDLFRGYLVLRQDRVQLINGDVAALLTLGEQLFDLLRHPIHQGAVGPLF